MKRPTTVGMIEACLCCPDVGYICRIHDGSEPRAIVEETGFPSESSANLVSVSSELIATPPWDVNESPPDLQGYGHRRADQDGGDGDEWVTPEQDKEREFFEALRMELSAESHL